MMWDAPLYAVNTFDYPLLIRRLLWPMARPNTARWEIQAEGQGEGRQSRGRHPLATTKEARQVENEVRPQPCRNT